MAAERKLPEFLKRMAVDFRAFKEYIEEMRSFRSFPWQKYKDQQDAAALAIHVNIPSGAILLKEEVSARQQLVDEIEKRIHDFGKQHGFPVAVVTTKEAVPPILCVGGRMYQDRFVHLFACSEIVRAVAFAKAHDGNIEMRDEIKIPQELGGVSMTEEQENCPYCHGQKGIAPNGEESYDEEAEGIFLIGNEIRAQADCGWIVFKGKINYCPICGRKLEA